MRNVGWDTKSSILTLNVFYSWAVKTDVLYCGRPIKWILFLPVEVCLFKASLHCFITALCPQNKQQRIKREMKADEEKVCLLGHHWLQRACDSLREKQRHKGSERQNEKEGDGSTCDLGRLRIRVAVCCPKGKKGLAHYFRRVTLVFTTRRINRNTAVQAAQVITVQHRLAAHLCTGVLSVSGNDHLPHSFVGSPFIT